MYISALQYLSLALHLGGERLEQEGRCGAPAKDKLPTSSLMLSLEIVLLVSLVHGMGWRKANGPYLSWGRELCN